MPRNVFGEGALLDMFYKTMKTYAPAAWELNQAFLAIWDKTALQYEWVLPDNFHVKSKVMDNVKETITFKGQEEEVFFKENVPTETGRSLGANVTHSVDGFIVRELQRRCNYDPKVFNKVLDAIENPKNRPLLEDMEKTKMVLTLWDRYKASGFLSARILDYLDSETISLVNTNVILKLLGSMPEKPFPVVAIHDCFRVHPNYGNDIREQYNRQLMLIAKSNMLSDIFTQLLGKPITIGKYDERMFENVIDAEYALS